MRLVEVLKGSISIVLVKQMLAYERSKLGRLQLEKRQLGMLRLDPVRQRRAPVRRQLVRRQLVRQRRAPARPERLQQEKQSPRGVEQLN